MVKYSSYKDSGVKWLGQIPSHWEVLALKYILRTRKILVGKHSSQYDLLSLTLQGVIKRDMDNPQGKFPSSFDTYQEVEPGDFVFCNFDNEETPRAVGLSPYHGMITGAYDVLYRTNPNFTDKFLIYYFLYIDDSKRFKPLYKGLRKTIPFDSFMSYKIPVPTLKEQDAMVAYLDAVTAKIDEAIAQQQRMIDLLNERKQIIVNEMVTKGLNNEAKFKYSGFNWIGVIPSHWEVKKLKYFINPSREKANANLPYIGLENIESHTGKFISTDSEYDLSQALLCKKGDLIFGKLRPYLAKAYLADSDYCCSSEFVVMRDAPNPEFLLYVMLSGYFVNKVDASTYGAKMPRADINYILNLPIAVPPIEEQIAIVDKVNMQFDVIDKMIAPKQKLLDLLQERKQIIINNVVTGKVKVV